MQRKLLAAFVVATVFWPVGCSEDYVPALRPKTIPEPEKSAAAEPTPEPSPAAESPPVQPSATREPAPLPKSGPISPPRSGSAPANPLPSKPPPPMANRHSIELSTGVSLPQTGPEGTMMMFSVEYEFVLGEPNSKAGYVWVIEREKGAPVKKAISLKNSDTLTLAISGWRPEYGPFRSHIEDRDGKRLSASIDMR